MAYSRSNHVVSSDSDYIADESCSEDEEQERCPICLLIFTHQAIAMPNSCKHLFCLPCINEWSKVTNTCPVDRIKFQNLRIFPSVKKDQTDILTVENVSQDNGISQVSETYCEICNECDREDRLLLCDECDLGYHCECLDPPLEHIPIEDWFCPRCVFANDISINSSTQDARVNNISLSTSSHSESISLVNERRRDVISSNKSSNAKKRKKMSRKTKQTEMRHRRKSKNSRKSVKSGKSSAMRKVTRTAANKHLEFMLNKVRNNVRKKRFRQSKLGLKAGHFGNGTFVPGPSPLSLTFDNSLVPVDEEDNFTSKDYQHGTDHKKGSSNYMQAVLTYHSNQHRSTNNLRRNDCKPLEPATETVDLVSKITEEMDNLRNIRKASVLSDGTIIMKKNATTQQGADKNTSTVREIDNITIKDSKDDYKADRPCCSYNYESTDSQTMINHSGDLLSIPKETCMPNELFEKVKETVKRYTKAYYRHGDIDKQEYKTIVKKSVDKVYRSAKNNDSYFESYKVKRLVKQYVGKYMGQKSVTNRTP